MTSDQAMATTTVPFRDTDLEQLIAQEKFVIDPAPLASDSTRFPVRRIGLRDRYNVHSWSLAGAISAQEIGASLISTDVFNTLATGLTYIYNGRERTSGVAANVSYAGLFPILDLGGRLGMRSAPYKTAGSTKTKRVTWNEKAVDAGIRLPFNFSRGYWTRAVQVGAQGSYSRVTDLAVPEAYLPGNGTFVPLTLGATAMNVHAPTYRDIAPRVGETLLLQWRTTSGQGDFHPTKMLAQSSVFLPAPVRHSMLRLYGGYEHHEPDNGITFSTSLDGARGYGYTFAPTNVLATADYELPIAYPDLAVGPVLYIPRLTFSGFGDYSAGSGTTTRRTRTSAGVELKTDMVPLNLDFLRFSLGVRAAYRFLDQRWVWEPAVAKRF